MWRARWLVAVVASGLPVLGCTGGAYLADGGYRDALVVGTERSLAVGLEDGADAEDRFAALEPAVSARVARALASARDPATKGMNTGWRMGAMYLGGRSADELLAKGTIDNRVISAWGYQFQWQYGEGPGTVGLVDVVPMLMGLDESMLIPSLSVLVGLRLPTTSRGCFEFGLGPHISPRAPELEPFSEDDDAHIAGLGIAGSIGWFFETPGGVNMSVNYSLMRSGDLTAHGVTFGWNFGM